MRRGLGGAGLGLGDDPTVGRGQGEGCGTGSLRRARRRRVSQVAAEVGHSARNMPLTRLTAAAAAANSGWPASARCTAGSSTSRTGHVPYLPTRRHHAPNAPGTTAGSRPVPRNEVEAEIVERLDRRRLRGDALPADDGRPLRQLVPDQDGHVATRPVQVRLDHLQREPGGGAGVSGVAAALQHAHAGRRRQPVRTGHHAEVADELRDASAAPLQTVTTSGGLTAGRSAASRRRRAKGEEARSAIARLVRSRRRRLRVRSISQIEGHDLCFPFQVRG